MRQKYGVEKEREEKFEGEFEWKGFEQVSAIQEQNANLLLELDEKNKEISRLIVISPFFPLSSNSSPLLITLVVESRLKMVMEMIEPIPGIDAERLVDILSGTEMEDKVITLIFHNTFFTFLFCPLVLNGVLIFV